MLRATRPFVLAAGLAFLLTGTAGAQGELGSGLAGAYLAARAAALDGDHRQAATYFEEALAVDPENGLLLGNAIFARAALGDWDRAAEIATDLPDEGAGRELGHLARLVTMLRAGDLSGARAVIDAGAGAGPFIDDLALAWIYLGEGDMRRATETFLEVAAGGALADIAYTQLGLAQAAVGNFEGAEAILSGQEYGSLTTTERVVEARAQVLMQLDRRDEAIALLTRFTESVPDASLLEIQARLAASDAPAPYSFVISAEQGLAEVFYTVARALGAEGGPTTLPLLYAQAANGIDPGHHASVMYVGRLFFDDDQFELAADTFDTVTPDSPHYVEAQMGRADAIFETGEEDFAVTVLQDLAAERPDVANVYASLGDMLRRTEQCEAAIDAYSQALDLVDTTQRSAWFLFYTRAICYEHIDDWPPAEADFRQALVLNPEQPNVLNYLGYSLVEQRRNLDEALDMIERAVAGRPDSGYITDSLGWVLYRLGRFEEAVSPMERAVALEPNDPIINDHLGDVYWMVGRYREAEFQWHRALSFEPEEEDAARIRLKLETGLYDVLEAEGGVGATQ